MTRSKFIGWFFDPIVSVGFPMPKIAFLPIFMLWLGLYDVSKIFDGDIQRDLPGDRRDACRS
jgi:ABC-type nitrate/sulfonate/bicarbonate transport system permease component